MAPDQRRKVSAFESNVTLLDLTDRAPFRPQCRSQGAVFRVHVKCKTEHVKSVNVTGHGDLARKSAKSQVPQGSCRHFLLHAPLHNTSHSRSMAEEGLRRSTRVRTAVQSYAVAQAEEADELVLRAPPLKRKKKNANIDDFDVQLTAPDVSSDAEVTKVVKKRTKKVTATKETTFETVPSQPSKKRKKTTTDTSWHAEAAENRIIRTKQQTKKLAPGKQEKRLRDYVDVPSDKYHRFVESANTQRMFVIDRERGVEESCHANHDDCPHETVQIAGSTGNVYTCHHLALDQLLLPSRHLQEEGPGDKLQARPLRSAPCAQGTGRAEVPKRFPGIRTSSDIHKRTIVAYGGC